MTRGGGHDPKPWGWGSSGPSRVRSELAPKPRGQGKRSAGPPDTAQPEGKRRRQGGPAEVEGSLPPQELPAKFPKPKRKPKKRPAAAAATPAEAAGSEVFPDSDGDQEQVGLAGGSSGDGIPPDAATDPLPDEIPPYPSHLDPSPGDYADFVLSRADTQKIGSVLKMGGISMASFCTGAATCKLGS